MKELGTLDGLEAGMRQLLEKNLRPEVLKEYDTLRMAFEIMKRDNMANKPQKGQLSLRDLLKPPVQSSQGKVIGAIIEHMDKTGKNTIRSNEILDYFEENNLFLSEWKDPSTRLGAILYTESKKKGSGRIEKVRGKRGVWRKKIEKPANPLEKQE
jgi:hypothetical protein